MPRDEPAAQAAEHVHRADDFAAALLLIAQAADSRARHLRGRLRDLHLSARKGFLRPEDLPECADDGEHYPIQSNYALNIITTFARSPNPGQFTTKSITIKNNPPKPRKQSSLP